MNVRDAMKLAAHVASGKATLPILGAVRIDENTISATDLTQQIEIPIDGDRPRHAPFCVAAARFTRVLKALPEDADLKFRVKDDKLHVTAGRTRYQLNTLPATDFPALENKPNGDAVSFKAPGKDLIKALTFCAPAMAVQDIRYYLNGLHIATGQGAIVLTATDGHRLHRVRIPLADQPDLAAAKGIVANSCIARIVELAERHGDIDITLGGARLLIDCEEQLSTKLIDGNFPDADRVIPADRPATGTVNSKELAAAIKRLVPIIAGNTHAGLRVDIRPDCIELESTNTEGELGAETFPWEAADPKFKGLKSGFNAYFVIEALEAFTTDLVNLHLPAGENESLYITDGDAGRCQVVIMPMRV